MTVPGQSSMTVPLASLSSDPQMRNSFVVQSDAAKGTLYASLTVFGGNTFRAVQLLGRDAWQPYNGGAHPWTTAGGATSTLLLFNYSSTPQTFYVWISGGGVQWRQRYELAALETKALDVGSLVATGVKDEVGQVLPPDAIGGVAQWTTFSFGKGTGRLLVWTQPGTGLARNFGCRQIRRTCGAPRRWTSSSLSFPVQSSGQMGPFWADCCMTTIGVCGGTNNGPMGWGANWTSYNTSVASIPSSQNQTAVTINGISAGSASIRADPLPETQTLPNGLPWSCYAASQNGSVTVWDATPTVTGISPPPNGFVVGTFADFHLTGQHFGTNLAQVAFSLGDTITVLSNTDTSIHATFTPAHAGTGTFTVTATGYGGQGFLPGPGQSPHSPPSPQATVNAAIQFAIQGKTFIYVGSDPAVTESNVYYAWDGVSGAPKPPGGRFLGLFQRLQRSGCRRRRRITSRKLHDLASERNQRRPNANLQVHGVRPAAKYQNHESNCPAVLLSHK